MTLTVRLDAATESALERYCAARGVTKSLVVQESIALYLLDRQAEPGATTLRSRGGRGATVSAAYKAFADAGLIGCVAGVANAANVARGQGADKAAVRARIAERFAERAARKVRG